jgi:hypothetical protein
MGYSLGALRRAVAGSGNATTETGLGTVHPDSSDCKMSHYILDNCGSQHGSGSTTNIKYYRDSGQDSATAWADLNAAGALVDAHWVCSGFLCGDFLGWSYYTYTVAAEDNLTWKNYKAACAYQIMEPNGNWTTCMECDSGALCGYSPITSQTSCSNLDSVGGWTHSPTESNGKFRVGYWNGDAGGSVNVTHSFQYKYHDGFNNSSTYYDTWRGLVQFNTKNA